MTAHHRWACYAYNPFIADDLPVAEAYWRLTIAVGWQPAINPAIVATLVHDGWDEWFAIATRIEGTIVAVEP